jgi:hypothetical protein
VPATSDAAVNGPAAGAGNELIVACDLTIAGRSATFRQTGPRVRSAPVSGATNVMSLQIGEKKARELSLLCRRCTATDAQAMGLVNEVADDEDEPTAERWSTEIAGLSQRYLEIAMISSNIWLNAVRDSFTTGLGMLMQAVGSPDTAGGATAFLQSANLFSCTFLRSTQPSAERYVPAGCERALPVSQKLRNQLPQPRGVSLERPIRLRRQRRCAAHALSSRWPYRGCRGGRRA